MDTIQLASREDVKRWVKESLFEFFKEHPIVQSKKEEFASETFLNRKQIAAFLKVSITTLQDWMNRGLPYHKYRGRVYFLHDEVFAYVKDNDRKEVLKKNAYRKRPKYQKRMT